MDWLSVKKDWIDNWSVDLSPIAPRQTNGELYKSGYDLWQAHAFPNNLGRTHKVIVRDNPRIGFRQPGMFIFDFDTKGRLVNAVYTGSQWGAITFDDYRPEIHRLLSGTWIQGKWEENTLETGLNYQPKIVGPRDAYYEMVMETLDGLVEVLRNAKISELEKMSAPAKQIEVLNSLPIKNHEGLLKESERFHSIIGSQIPVMPPQLAFYHYQAIPVRVQNGCGGGCTYCDFYENRKIEILPQADVLKQIDQMAEYLGEEVDHFEQVVLIDGDALTVPTEQLAVELRYAREKFGFLPNEMTYRPWNFAHAFAKYKTILGKTEEELAYLREQGLHYINMGLETGCKELARIVKPGQELEGFREAVKRLVKVDIKVSINIIVGLGGKKFADRHVNETINFLQTLPPEITVFYAYLERKESSRYVQQEERFEPLADSELVKQAQAFQRILPRVYKYLFIPM